MSVIKETMELRTAAIKSGVSTDGSLVRSKLTNRLVWRNREVDENDIGSSYLSMMGGIGDGGLAMVNPEPVPIPEKDVRFSARSRAAKCRNSSNQQQSNNNNSNNIPHGKIVRCTTTTSDPRQHLPWEVLHQQQENNNIGRYPGVAGKSQSTNPL
ncbi:uncharacterized protein LOC129752176 isoform X2 [Uranotaenia lowii]|uniref:uncharacterized protein LOC129752176 isoform X2 n=1 Tax=Uranotaenia lowii TaxID=190385 RepID=UPI00247A5BB8|nr:uncharacterized protein LOC129752176 isoform X2 [Uranotaenia lowii]